MAIACSVRLLFVSKWRCVSRCIKFVNLFEHFFSGIRIPSSSFQLLLSNPHFPTCSNLLSYWRLPSHLDNDSSEFVPLATANRWLTCIFSSVKWKSRVRHSSFKNLLQQSRSAISQPNFRINRTFDWLPSSTGALKWTFSVLIIFTCRRSKIRNPKILWRASDPKLFNVEKILNVKLFITSMCFGLKFVNYILKTVSGAKTRRLRAIFWGHKPAPATFFHCGLQPHNGNF